MTAQTVQDAINLVGIFAFALSGALMAVRKDLDIIGMMVLASITALGGGVIFDAVGLGVFCASATAKAASFGIGPYAAVLLGVTTGIGGGMLRDVLAGEIPSVLRRDTKLYAVPAVAGCIVVSVAQVLGEDGVWVQALAAAGICIIRLLALWRRWGAPAPRHIG